MAKRSPLFRVANGLMTLLFAFSAAVQYNDPDPLRWMAIYGLAAIASGLSLGRRLHPALPGAIGAAALVWAATLAPRVWGRVPIGQVFGAVEMKSVAIEETREMIGLLIIAFWMGVLCLLATRRLRGRS